MQRECLIQAVISQPSRIITSFIKNAANLGLNKAWFYLDILRKYANEKVHFSSLCSRRRTIMVMLRKNKSALM